MASWSGRALMACGVAAVAVGCTSFEAGEPTPPVVEAGADAPVTAAADAAAAVEADTGAPLCPSGLALLGRFATLTGKVNAHTPASTSLSENSTLDHNGWFPDPDCDSGANVNDLAYCKRLWPGSTVRLGPFPADSETKPLYAAGCGDRILGTGRDLFACCGK